MIKKEIRESKKILGNEYVGKSKYCTLEIKQANFATLNFELIGYDKMGAKNIPNEEKSVHFFEDDIEFESVFNSHGKQVKN